MRSVSEGHAEASRTTTSVYDECASTDHSADNPFLIFVSAEDVGSGSPGAILSWDLYCSKSDKVLM